MQQGFSAAPLERIIGTKYNFSKKPEEITEVDKSLYERLAYDWVVQFIDIYHTRHITPYVHAMKCHVVEFLHLFYHLFIQHGLEKYNDVVTKNFFQASCHRGEEVLVQTAKNKIDWNIYGNVTRNHQKHMPSLVQTAHKLDIIGSHAHNHANFVDIPITSST